MNRELTKILKTVYENTGIDVLLYASDGSFIASATGRTFFRPVKLSFDTVFSDTESHRTHFKLYYKTDRLFGEIEGDGAVAANYAYMLSNLIENMAAREGNLSKEEYAKRILLGDCSGADVHKFKIKYAVPELPFYVLAVRSGQKIAEVLNISAQYVTNGVDFAVKIGERECVIVKFIEDDGEYQSSADFAFFLANSMYEELGTARRDRRWRHFPPFRGRVRILSAGGNGAAHEQRVRFQGQRAHVPRVYPHQNA